MSQLLIVTDVDRATGFLLAGVQAVGAADGQAAATAVREWYEGGERGLVAIDSRLMEETGELFREWLADKDDLFLVEISAPIGEMDEARRRERYLEHLRETIGFSIAFGEEGTESE